MRAVSCLVTSGYVAGLFSTLGHEGQTVSRSLGEIGWIECRDEQNHTYPVTPITRVVTIRLANIVVHHSGQATRELQCAGMGGLYAMPTVARMG